MSNICKTVSLRTRKIKNGRMLSYYLDYYPGYRDESTMKVIRHESRVCHKSVTHPFFCVFLYILVES